MNHPLAALAGFAFLTGNGDHRGSRSSHSINDRRDFAVMPPQCVVDGDPLVSDAAWRVDSHRDILATEHRQRLNHQFCRDAFLEKRSANWTVYKYFACLSVN